MRVLLVIAANSLLFLAAPLAPAQGTKESNKKPTTDTEIRDIGGKTLEEWIKEIPSEDRSRGENAIRTVQAFGADRACAAVPLLIKELKKQTHFRRSIDVSIRVNAVMALGNILSGAESPDPEQANEAAKVLRLLLHDSQAVVKYRAVEALGRIGRRAKPAIPDLLMVLRDRYTTWETRQAAATVLGFIALDREGKKGPPAEVVKALYAALSDSSFQVRRAAIQSMTFLGTPANTSKADRDAFLSHLKPKATSEKEDGGVRIWARMAMMSIGHEMGQADILGICKMLKDRNPDIRIQATQALAICGGSAFNDPKQVKERGIMRSAINPLIAALDDKEPVVALNAMTSLLSMGTEGKRALTALQEISRDKKRPRPLREAALKAISILNGSKEKAPSVPQTIEDEKTVPANTQIQELGGKTLEEWIKDIRSKDCSRSERAIHMVQAFGPDRALEAVPTLLAELKVFDLDVSVRINAVMALGNILGVGGANKPEPKLVDEAVKALYRFLAASSERQAMVRYRAAEALGKIGPHASPAIPRLVILLHDTSTWEVRQAAAAALGFVALDNEKKSAPSADVAKGLLNAINDHSFQVRLAAIRSIAVLGSAAKTDEKERQTFIDHLKPKADSAKEHAAVRLWARMAIVSISRQMTKTDIQDMCKLLKDRELFVRIQTAQALAICGASDEKHFKDRSALKEAITPLIGGLRDKEPIVVINCMGALTKMGKEGKRAIPALQRFTRDTSRPKELRDAATETISILNGTRAQAAPIENKAIQR